MRRYTVYQVDSFTETKFRGNPAGVVLNADGLTEDDMHNIARELNNSETAFLFSSEEKDCDGELRYFTPKVEVPTCGHATIAALFVKAHENKLNDCILNIKTKVGILPMEIIRRPSGYYISMTQGTFEIVGSLTDEEQTELINALGIKEDDLEKRCPVQIVSTGHSKVMIGLKSRDTMNGIIPDNEKLKQLSVKIRCNGYFVFTFDTDKPGILTEGRMFAPAIGINEDPVTGNANGPFGGYLIANGIANPEGNVFRFTGYQGEAINRPGKIDVEILCKNGKPEKVKIGGKAVIVFRTEIDIE
jgi:PhzF family phenazine biosynthesis protein